MILTDVNWYAIGKIPFLLILGIFPEITNY
jgi:hypothetical protein